MNSEVVVYTEDYLKYPDQAPYSPSSTYPEYPLKHISGQNNRMYAAVRNTLFHLKLDEKLFGTPLWNPLGQLIKPGDTVIIKPNFVIDSHKEGGELYSIITHPSIIRAVVDYVYIALEGNGRIIIADAPQMDADFNAILGKTKLEAIQDLYSSELGFELEVIDLREFWCDTRKSKKAQAAYTKYRTRLPGDPQGQVIVDLGEESLLYGLDHRNFYGADYDRMEVMSYHHGKAQKYVMSRTVLSANVMILLPKLKVHQKVGVTLNMKCLVGTVTNKNCLVHYRLGTPLDGGDQLPEAVLRKKEKVLVGLERLAADLFLSHGNPAADAIYDFSARLAKRFFKKLALGIRKDIKLLDYGNWYGNDTAWRMVVDLYKVLLYADSQGNLHKTPVRKFFSIIDGIIAGEGKGPLAPFCKECRTLVAGFNPIAVDVVSTRLMGFDYNRVKMISYVLDHPDIFKTRVDEIVVRSNGRELNGLLHPDNRNTYFDFKPPPGWEGFWKSGMISADC